MKQKLKLNGTNFPNFPKVGPKLKKWSEYHEIWYVE